MKKHFNCPACNKFNNKIYFNSVKKDLSFPNFNYLKCNCSTIYVSNKNLNSKKLEKLHQLNWHKNNKFKFSETKDRNKIINNLNGWSIFLLIAGVMSILIYVILNLIQ